MKKPRIAERRKVLSFTPVYDLETNDLLGYLGDLTLQGALLVGEKPMESGKNLTLGVEFREASEIPGKRLTIPVHVAWCRREEHLNYFNTGLEFLEMTESNKDLIEAVLERYRFNREIPY